MSGFSDRLDFNGDGTPDLILQRDDDQGNLQDLRVIDGQTQQVLWEMLNVQFTLGSLQPPGFIIYGFANVVDGEQPEVIFTSAEDVLLIDSSDNTLVSSITAEDDWEAPVSTKVRLLAAIDFTGNNKKELLIFLPDTKELQVWHEKLP